MSVSNNLKKMNMYSIKVESACFIECDILEDDNTSTAAVENYDEFYEVDELKTD